MQGRGDLFGKHLLGGKICEHRTFVRRALTAFPNLTDFDHAQEPGLEEAAAALIPEVSFGAATLGQSEAQGRALDDYGRLQRLVNQDLMGLSEAGDCGLPLKGDTRRLRHGRFLHGLSDGWSASPCLRHAGDATVRRFGDYVFPPPVDAKDSTRLIRESESMRRGLRFVPDLFCP